MTAFTDQFDRQTPLEFSPSLIRMEGWPLKIATEAKNLLKGRTQAEVISIAAAVDSVIIAGARKEMLTHPDFGSTDPDDPYQSSALSEEQVLPEFISQVRVEYGDLRLFNGSGGCKAPWIASMWVGPLCSGRQIDMSS